MCSDCAGVVRLARLFPSRVHDLHSLTLTLFDHACFHPLFSLLSLSFPLLYPLSLCCANNTMQCKCNSIHCTSIYCPKQALGCDFLAASGHKMCGPTGIGFLWSKYDTLLTMPPVDGGGEMIGSMHTHSHAHSHTHSHAHSHAHSHTHTHTHADTVTLEGSTYALPPSRFEPGTPPIAECVGLASAVRYIRSIGMDR